MAAVLVRNLHCIATSRAPELSADLSSLAFTSEVVLPTYAQKVNCGMSSVLKFVYVTCACKHFVLLFLAIKSENTDTDKDTINRRWSIVL